MEHEDKYKIFLFLVCIFTYIIFIYLHYKFRTLPLLIIASIIGFLMGYALFDVILLIRRYLKINEERKNEM